MAQNLTMNPTAWDAKNEENLEPRRPPIQYEVRGSASGVVARIAKFDTSWKVLHVKDGVQKGGWAGEYKSENEALDALQKEYND